MGGNGDHRGCGSHREVVGAMEGLWEPWGMVVGAMKGCGNLGRVWGPWEMWGPWLRGLCGAVGTVGVM